MVRNLEFSAVWIRLAVERLFFTFRGLHIRRYRVLVSTHGDGGVAKLLFVAKLLIASCFELTQRL